MKYGEPMNVKKKLTACLANPIKRELRDLQRKYADVYPQPLRSIKVLRPWDIPLLEHYLYHRAKDLGREVAYRDHSWPPKAPKPNTVQWPITMACSKGFVG